MKGIVLTVVIVFLTISISLSQSTQNELLVEQIGFVSLPKGVKHIYYSAFSPNNNYFTFLSSTNDYYLFNLASNTFIKLSGDFERTVYFPDGLLKFTADSKYLISIDTKLNLNVWKTDGTVNSVYSSLIYINGKKPMKGNIISYYIDAEGLTYDEDIKHLFANKIIFIMENEQSGYFGYEVSKDRVNLLDFMGQPNLKRMKTNFSGEIKSFTTKHIAYNPLLSSKIVIINVSSGEKYKTNISGFASGFKLNSQQELAYFYSRKKSLEINLNNYNTKVLQVGNLKLFPAIVSFDGVLTGFQRPNNLMFYNINEPEVKCSIDLIKIKGMQSLKFSQDGTILMAKNGKKLYFFRVKL